MSHPVSFFYTVDEDGGTCEIISGERLMANLSSQAACGIFHVEQRDCEWTNGVLPFALDPCSVDGDGEHTWIEQTFDGPTWVGNPAPWWDGVIGSPSSQAYGIWVEEWTGLDGSHHRRNVSSRAGRRGGGNFGGLFSGHRVWKMNLILVGANGAALEDLFRWLESQLLDCCDPCSGQDALIRTACPPDGDPEFGLYKVKGMAMIEGPAWEAPPIETLGCVIRRVSVTLGVSDPCLYSCATSCTSEESFPFVGACVDFDVWMGCGNTCESLADFRICCPVPATTRGTTAPIVTIRNDSTVDSTAIRIYGMSDPLGLGCDPCSLSVCQDITTRSIPAGGTLVVDSATRKVLYKNADTGDVFVDGTSFLDPPDGTIPSFLALSCDPGWVAIEPASFCGNTDSLVFSVDTVVRTSCC